MGGNPTYGKARAEEAGDELAAEVRRELEPAATGEHIGLQKDAPPRHRPSAYDRSTLGETVAPRFSRRDESAASNSASSGPRRCAPTLLSKVSVVSAAAGERGRRK